MQMKPTLDVLGMMDINICSESSAPLYTVYSGGVYVSGGIYLTRGNGIICYCYKKIHDTG